MTTTEDLQNLVGRTAVDSDGSKIGTIGQVYVDDQSGQPLWVTISTGMFGSRENFAPLYGSRTSGDSLQLAVSKDMVTDAPSVDADGHISDSENDALYTYYDGYLGDSTARDTAAPETTYQDHDQDQGQYAADSRQDLPGRATPGTLSPQAEKTVPHRLTQSRNPIDLTSDFLSNVPKTTGGCSEEGRRHL